MPELTKKERREVSRAVGLMTQIAVTMAGCVVIGVLIGLFIDNRLSTSPWFVLIFSFFGVAAAFKALYDMSQKFHNKE